MFASSFVLLFSFLTGNALDNGLGLTPPMGWNSWNHFECHISEDTIRRMAQALKDGGFLDAGYDYVNLDDCWQVGRNESGFIVEDKEKFPSGMGSLAADLHEMGFKVGIYSDAGTMTCGGRPGSLGYETQDAIQYADWGIDFLKYDNCYNEGVDVIKRYRTMRDALNATGRPIFYSLCGWGTFNPHKWAREIGNMWRTTLDIKEDWDAILRVTDNSFFLGKYAGPGGWNDPDMLEVGVGTELRSEEQISHFVTFCVMKAPLILGADIETLSDEIKELLLNPELIAINQDPLGVAGDVIFWEGSEVILGGPLSGGSKVAVLWNRHMHDNAPVDGLDTFGPYPGGYTKTFHNGSYMELDFSLLGWDPDVEVNVRDILSRKDLGTFQGSIELLVPIHGARALKLAPVEDYYLDEDWRPWETHFSTVNDKNHDNLVTTLIILLGVACILCTALAVALIMTCRRYHPKGGWEQLPQSA